MTKEEAMKKYDLIPKPKVEVIELSEWDTKLSVLFINGTRIFMNSYSSSKVAELLCSEIDSAINSWTKE